MSLSSIALLSCGNYENHVGILEVYENLANTISTLENRIFLLPTDNDSNITLFGPFLARTILETAFTALLGRIDPFRILVVKNVQQQDSFGLGSRSNAAIKWFGDIFEEGLTKDELLPEKMWSSRLDFNRVGRGLLGDYYGEVYWKNAFESVLDRTVEYSSTDPLEDYRRLQPKHLMVQIRKEASRLYSSLSKGVHSELVIKSDIIYDRTTVLELVADTLKMCGFLSLLSHQIYSSICLVPFVDAISIFSNLKERVDIYGR